ncbi:MAG: 4-hydroxythreonine-4-phosphate dehydrogenase PdxA [Luteimonas sp.]
MPRPRLALVPGEPAGVGPELCVRAAQRAWDANLTVFGDPRSLLAAAAALKLPLALAPPGAPSKPGVLPIVEIAAPIATRFGHPAAGNATSTIAALEQAGGACLRGDFQGLVTGPVHKAAINEGGIAYTGTTGLLASQAGCEVVMMLANDVARVALVTTHLPLREVPGAITVDALVHKLRVLHASLRVDFGVALPRIAVLGLNPHAGEDGHLGREELDVIGPAIEQMRAIGMDLVGPLPADTAFLPAKLAHFDAVLAMYHDQGLPVLKYSGFEHAVNLSLGLPYPRVAVDHGTALDIAGDGSADPSSLFAAISTCTRMAAARIAAATSPA